MERLVAVYSLDGKLLEGQSWRMWIRSVLFLPFYQNILGVKRKSVRTVAGLFPDARDKLLVTLFWLFISTNPAWCNGKHRRLSHGSSGFDSPYRNIFFFSFFLQKIIDLKHYFSIIFILLYFLGWRWSNSSRASSPGSERCCRLLCALLKGGIRTLYIWTTQLDPPCPTMNTSELPSIFPSSILTPTVALTWLTIHWTWKWAMLLLALKSSRFSNHPHCHVCGRVWSRTLFTIDLSFTRSWTRTSMTEYPRTRRTRNYMRLSIGTPWILAFIHALLPTMTCENEMFA